jgi:hypothetical protein
VPSVELHAMPWVCYKLGIRLSVRYSASTRLPHSLQVLDLSTMKVLNDLLSTNYAMKNKKVSRLLPPCGVVFFALSTTKARCSHHRSAINSRFVVLRFSTHCLQA